MKTKTNVKSYSKPVASPLTKAEAPQPIAPGMAFKIVMTTAVMNPDQKLY
jgi:hypothetical protein